MATMLSQFARKAMINDRHIGNIHRQEIRYHCKLAKLPNALTTVDIKLSAGQEGRAAGQVKR
jgi:hypothetical protein